MLLLYRPLFDLVIYDQCSSIPSEVMACRKIQWITVVITILVAHSPIEAFQGFLGYPSSSGGYPSWGSTNLPSEPWWKNMRRTSRTGVNSLKAPAYSPGQFSAGPQYCGTSPSDPFSDRIVGGVEVVPHEFPWVAKLFHDKAFHCGAALISDRYLLTAGHCVTSHIEGTSTEPRSRRGDTINYEVKDPKDFIVELGSHKLKEKSGDVVRKKVIRIILNSEYDVFASDDIMLQSNDLAILKINPVVFSDIVSPICLPMMNARVRDGAKLIVAGWGSTLTETLQDPTTKLPDALQKAFLTKISHRECKKNPYIGSHLTKINQMGEREIFCMIGNNQDSCRGDSGGPAILRTPQGYVVAGLVSWGLGCNQKNYPAAYTQVSSYMDYILENTRDGKFLPHKP
uniref:Transmembrane protease serine 9 n=2 Tax=Lygus hesperus TaxID=30085 RepID=A0A0A9X5Z2_LYGHE